MSRISPLGKKELNERFYSAVDPEAAFATEVQVGFHQVAAARLVARQAATLGKQKLRVLELGASACLFAIAFVEVFSRLVLLGDASVEAIDYTAVEYSRAALEAAFRGAVGHGFELSSVGGRRRGRGRGARAPAPAGCGRRGALARPCRREQLRRRDRGAVRRRDPQRAARRPAVPGLLGRRRRRDARARALRAARGHRRWRVELTETDAPARRAAARHADLDLRRVASPGRGLRRPPSAAAACC